MRDGTVSLPDGRVVGFGDAGPDGGFPVLHCHGTPSSRHLGLAAPAVDAAGARVVTVERPGVGLSTRLPGRRILDVVDDLRAVADALGFERFGVVGSSAGGPYALAAGARLAGRVTAVALRGSVGQRVDRPDLDHEQPDEIAQLLPLVRADPDGSVAALPLFMRPRAEAWNADPDGEWDRFLAGLDAGDRRLIESQQDEWRASLAAAFRDPDGYVDEIIANVLPWGFDPCEVPVPVRAWHGARDREAPLAVLRPAVESAGGEVVVDPAGGHHPTPAWDGDLLAWLASHA